MLVELLLAVPAARALASAAAGRADAVVDEREQLFNESLMMPGPATASPQRGWTDRCLTRIHSCRTCLPACNKRSLLPTSQGQHRTWVQHGHEHFAFGSRLMCRVQTRLGALIGIIQNDQVHRVSCVIQMDCTSCFHHLC